MRRSWLTAIVAVLALAGCGDGDDRRDRPQPRASASPSPTPTPTPTPAETESTARADLAAINAVCRRFARLGRKLPQPDFDEPASLGRFLRGAERLAQRQQDALTRLPAPAGDEEQMERLVEAAGRATDLLGAVVDAQTSGERQRGLRAVARVSRQLDRAATAMGATECAGS